jgi:hypothetical protein
LPHAEGKISIRGFDHQVVVVVHETVGVAKPVVAFIDVGKDSEKRLPVLVILKYSFFVVSPVGDVIHRAGVFDAQRTSHEGSLSESSSKSQTV